jgi:ferritin-like metal-binding protein YciE
MKLNALTELLHDQLKDLHSAEGQLTKALPKMAKEARSPKLKQAIEAHLEETRAQLERLERIGDALEFKLTGKKCKAMVGLVEEGAEVLGTEGDATILDLAIIAAAQRVEHYEIASYGVARELASRLGHQDAVKLLQQTLDEEGAADKKLTAIAMDLYPSATAENWSRGSSTAAAKTMK